MKKSTPLLLSLIILISTFSCMSKYAVLNIKTATENTDVKAWVANGSSLTETVANKARLDVQTKGLPFLSTKKKVELFYSKYGYENVEQNTYVSFFDSYRKGQNYATEINVPELKPSSYYYAVSIESTPSNAQAYINGAFIGNTPIVEHLYKYNLTSKNADSLKISVTQANHRTEYLNLYIANKRFRNDRDAQANRYVAKLTLKPERFYHTVKVETDVENAQVFLDNEKIGTTPLTKTIEFFTGDPSKKRLLKIEHPDYKTVERTIELRPKYASDTDSRTNAEHLNFSLEPKKYYAAYQVLTTPTAASVSLAETGEFIGETPTKIQVLPLEDKKSTTISFRIEMEGYIPQNKNLVVAADAIFPNRDLAAKNPKLLKVLMEKKGTPIPVDGKTNINITSDPPGASVEIDGKSFGTTDCTVPVDWGQFGQRINIIARKSGYKEETKSISNGDINPIRFVLQKIE